MYSRILTYFKNYLYCLVGSHISSASRHFDQVLHFLPTEFDDGSLLSRIECSSKRVVSDAKELDSLKSTALERKLILLNGNINYSLDIEGLLGTVKSRITANDRLLLVAYNTYLRWFYLFCNVLGIRSGPLPQTFITRTSVKSIARLAGFEVVSVRSLGVFPLRLLGVGDLINKLVSIIPLVKWFGLCSVLMLRPQIARKHPPSLSVIVPARNEKGNIADALMRIPRMDGVKVEVIFVEGNSSDGTWEEIQRCRSTRQEGLWVAAYQQSGKGKGDAVRLGFAKASCDLVVILDADLSTPPELLTTFYSAYCAGLGDFINGNRLVYPIEGKAMRFLNRIGNIFFAKALSAVLEVPLGDSLCGTKLFPRHDIIRFIRWRERFGDFDPFGDFELLFPAAVLGLGIVDVPLHYRDRVYGATNIHRFRHGVMLLKMTIIGFVRIKLRLF